MREMTRLTGTPFQIFRCAPEPQCFCTNIHQLQHKLMRLTSGSVTYTTVHVRMFGLQSSWLKGKGRANHGITILWMLQVLPSGLQLNIAVVRCLRARLQFSFYFSFSLLLLLFPLFPLFPLFAQFRLCGLRLRLPETFFEPEILPQDSFRSPRWEHFRKAWAPSPKPLPPRKRVFFARLQPSNALMEKTPSRVRSRRAALATRQDPWRFGSGSLIF